MKEIAKIYESTDYSIFKRLEGNRSITAARAKKIRKSIVENGYIFSPIAVNENMEVIDGQGRLEALSELGLPIHYYIIRGAGREQCITLNVYGTSWSINDYIKSYAECGIEDYKFLGSLMACHPSFNLKVIVYAITGKECADRYIKGGDFRCSREEFLAADRVLEKCQRVQAAISTIPGSPSNVYRAYIFALTHCDIDEERMVACLERNKGTIQRIGTMKEALEMLSDIYNFKCRTKRLYLYQDYDRFQRGKFGWYEKKWGSLNSEANAD